MAIRRADAESGLGQRSLRALARAAGRGQRQRSDSLFYNTNIAGTDNYANQIAFSMGCHAGLSIPDSSVADAQSQPDFPQALAQRGAAAWVANTGNGYGMDDAVAASEQLMLFFTQEMGAQASVPIGKAFVAAKQRYVGSAPAGGFGVYDEKALTEATLYGLPMLNVSVPAPQPIGAGAISSLAGAPFALGGLTGLPLTVQMTPTLHTAADGVYYSLGGEVQASAGRPVQPRSSVPAAAVANHSLRGTLLISATYSDMFSFDPLVTRLVTDTTLSEPPLVASGWFPPRFWAANQFGDQNRISIVGGQFNRNGSVERLYGDLQLETYHVNDASPEAADFLPPTVWDVSSEIVVGGANFAVVAQDNSSLARVLVTHNVPGGGGAGLWKSVDLSYNAGSMVWTASVPGLDDSSQFFVQALDKAGNVTLASNSGQYFTVGAVVPDAVSPVNTLHSLTVRLEFDQGDGSGFTGAPDGTVGFVVSLEGVGSIVSDTCSDGTLEGECQVVFTSSVPGTAKASVSWAGDIGTGARDGDSDVLRLRGGRDCLRGCPNRSRAVERCQRDIRSPHRHSSRATGRWPDHRRRWRDRLWSRARRHGGDVQPVEQHGRRDVRGREYVRHFRRRLLGANQLRRGRRCGHPRRVNRQCAGRELQSGDRHGRQQRRRCTQGVCRRRAALEQGRWCGFAAGGRNVRGVPNAQLRECERHVCPNRSGLLGRSRQQRSGYRSGERRAQTRKPDTGSICGPRDGCAGRLSTSIRIRRRPT